MHLMYVDESGDDGFSKNGRYNQGQTPTPFFIRCGVILHDQKWRRIVQQIEGWRFSNKIPKTVELHATEILNGKEKYYTKNHRRKSRVNWFGKHYPTKKDRRDLLLSCCSMIRNLPITIIGIVIDKEKIYKENQACRQYLKQKSWEFLIERYNLFLRNAKDKRGLIISDAITDQIEQEHRLFARSLFLHSDHINEFYFIESILFEPSESSELLQICDVVAYAFNRSFNNSDSRYLEYLDKLLLSYDGSSEGRGVKLWPSHEFE